jgi:hypothetical protein
MTHTMKYAMAIACVTFAVSLTAAGPSAALERSGTTSASASRITDISARKKQRAPRAAAVTPPQHQEWTGADPTKGKAAENIRQMQREGRCIIDEGYGRYSGCSND